MKTEKELNDDIIKITTTIKEKFPELSKYIIEMPFKSSEIVSLEMTIKKLKEYYDSLDALLKNYTTTHNAKI